MAVLPESHIVATEESSRVTAHIGIVGLDQPASLRVMLDGRVLAPLRIVSDRRLDVDLPPGVFPGGRWTFHLAAGVGSDLFRPSGRWQIEYDGQRLPSEPWSFQRKERTVVALEDGALRVADLGTQPGDYQYVSALWGLAEGGRAVIEARVMVREGMNALLFGAGPVQQQLELHPGSVRWGMPPRSSRTLDTTSDFRNYRIEVDGPDLRLFVDGQLFMETPGGFMHTPGWYRQRLAFGAGTSPVTGEALWQIVRARVDSVAITDLACTVQPE